jgi:peptidoglycan-N-acetylglucosamine deacetylase
MDFTIYKTPRLAQWLYPTLTWRKKTHEKVIYLTFDDGPVPGATELVLQTLAQCQAKATFFCIGDNIRKHPVIFESVLAAGHAIGNHTFNHIKGWATSTEKYVANVRLFEQEIEAGPWRVKPTMFRPPYGRITRAQIAALDHYEIVMWDVLTHDYQITGKPDPHLRGAIQATQPGSIVVFHDSYKAQPKLEFILPRYIEHFAALGFQFQRLPEQP